MANRAALQPDRAEPRNAYTTALRAILALDLDDRERLAPFFTAAALRAARLAARNEALLTMGVGRPGDTRAIAREVHAELARYAASAWRHDLAAGTPRHARHALAFRVLALQGDDRGLSVRNLERLFAPTAGAKGAPGNGAASRARCRALDKGSRSR